MIPVAKARRAVFYIRPMCAPSIAPLRPCGACPRGPGILHIAPHNFIYHNILLYQHAVLSQQQILRHVGDTSRQPPQPSQPKRALARRRRRHFHSTIAYSTAANNTPVVVTSKLNPPAVVAAADPDLHRDNLHRSPASPPPQLPDLAAPRTATPSPPMTSTPIASATELTPVDAPRFPNRATVRLTEALHLRLAALMARTEVYQDEV